LILWHSGATAARQRRDSGATPTDVKDSGAAAAGFQPRRTSLKRLREKKFNVEE